MPDCLKRAARAANALIAWFRECIAATLAVALNRAISAADRSNTASLILGLSAALLLVQSKVQNRFLP